MGPALHDQRRNALQYVLGLSHITHALIYQSSDGLICVDFLKDALAQHVDQLLDNFGALDLSTLRPASTFCALLEPASDVAVVVSEDVVARHSLL